MPNARTVQSWTEKHEFLLRRLHSLTGIVPIGAFLIEHMFTNSVAWLGPEKYDEHVHWLHQLPYLVWLEILFIFLPLAYHAVYGVIIALTSKLNAAQYPYFDNWRYTLQRLAGWTVLGFVIVHVLHFRFGHWFGLERFPGTEHPFLLTQQGFSVLLPSALWVVIYAVGLTAAILHFSNGLTTFCITWGITIGQRSRRGMSVAASGLGIVLLIWGFLSLAAFRFREYQPKRPGEAAAHLPLTGQRSVKDVSAVVVQPDPQHGVSMTSAVPPGAIPGH